MTEQKNSSGKTAGFFSYEDRGLTTILRIEPREGLPGPDLSQMNQLWRLFTKLTERKRKLLVIIVPPGLLSAENVDRFWDQLKALSPYPNGRGWEATSPGELYLLREENAFRRFISAVRGMKTFVICALQGEIVFPFLGLALACDYRVVSEDTVFTNRCLELGMPPCGALPWFLSRFIGQGKTARILFEEESLSANDALELGLVNRVVCPDELERTAIGLAESFASTPTEGLLAAKRMINAAHGSLGTYLELEGQVFERCLHPDHESSAEDGST